MKVPKTLDAFFAIVDAVLAYKPPGKAKATKRREKRRAKRNLIKAPRIRRPKGAADGTQAS